MAEILLSLTIIGVVAAITLPSLTGNINERTWNTQRKALYSRISQAVALMPALNGYGTLNATTDTATETFITSGLAKVLKMNNICSSNNINDCGLPEKITTMAGTKIALPTEYIGIDAERTTSGDTFGSTKSKVAAFETANGESVAAYYNPRCTVWLAHSNTIFASRKICVNFIYDLNGKKGPNTFGKDIGIMTVFYPSDSVVVAPMPHSQDATDSIASTEISGICKKQDEGYRLPTKEELGALFINKAIIGNMNGQRYYSASLYSTIDDAWYVEFTKGILNHDARFDDLAVRCIQR